MGKPNQLIRLRECAGSVAVQLRRPSLRYLDEFLRLKCVRDLMLPGLWPDAKEVTESMCAYSAVRSRLGKHLGDPQVAAVVVGDGCSPRTAALFAYRSRWTVYSVDPRMRDKWVARPPGDRVDPREQTIEAFALFGPVMPQRVVIVGVHAHVALSDALHGQLVDGRHATVVWLPCCVEAGEPPEGFSLVRRYTDWGCWSPEREVSIYERDDRENARA